MDNHDRGKYFADHSHDETIGYHSEHQVNSKYKRELRHVPTEQCFQPQQSINHPDYPVYHTNYQYAEPTLSVPLQNPDLIKDAVSNQQMINYHVLTSPAYLGLYHQFDSISSTPYHVGSTQRTSFQGVSYQADASRSLGVPTKGTKVNTDFSSHPIQSQADGGRSSCFSSLMTHVDYPSQSNDTMIATPSINAVCSTTSLSQEQVSMDYHDSYVSLSPVHANVSTTAASYIYTYDHLQFDSQSTSVQSESLHSHA